MQPQYWVIGGEYDGLEFTRLVAETCEVFGPFRNYHDAKLVWREQSMASRYKALMRYCIVRNANSETPAQVWQAAA